MSQNIALNPDIASIPRGARLTIINATRGKRDLADLASGNPNMPMPPFIRDRIKADLDVGYARYTDFFGVAALRERIADYLKGECGISADPETEVLVTHGVQEALYVVLRTLLRPGDEVLIPSPHYGNYYIDSVACGAKPVLVPLREEDGFQPDLERLEAAISPQTRALIFSNPNNPLGVLWPGEVLEKIAGLAQAHNLIVLVDEVYHDYYSASRPVSIAALPGMKGRTFTFNGFSKAYVMMGLRIGYVAGPAEVMGLVKQLHYAVALCPSSVGQVAALASFDCPREQVNGIYREYQSLIETLYEGVVALPGVSCVRPPAGFYLFPNFKRLGVGSLELSLQLIKDAGVVTLPGTEFGPAGEGHLRLSVAAGREDVEKGVAMLTRFFQEKA
jgi:aspartate/methionine/tyrosine aminotransferase